MIWLNLENKKKHEVIALIGDQNANNYLIFQSTSVIGYVVNA